MTPRKKKSPVPSPPVAAAVATDHPLLIHITADIEKTILARNHVLSEAILMFNGMLRAREERAFPPVWPVLTVRAHLQLELATLGARNQARGTRRSAVEADNNASESVTGVLKRLETIVTNSYEIGESGRSDFFPTVAESTESERLTAIIAGSRRHDLMLPDDLGLPVLDELVARAKAEETARDAAEKAHQNKSAAGRNLHLTTMDIHRRLGGIIRGRCGKYSPKLANYGMKVPKRPIGRGARKKPEGTADPGAAKTLKETKGKGKNKKKKEKAPPTTPPKTKDEVATETEKE